MNNIVIGYRENDAAHINSIEKAEIINVLNSIQEDHNINARIKAVCEYYKANHKYNLGKFTVYKVGSTAKIAVINLINHTSTYYKRNKITNIIQW